MQKNSDGIVYVMFSRHHGSNNQLMAIAETIKQKRLIKPIHCELRTRAKILYPFYRWLCNKFFIGSCHRYIVNIVIKFFIRGSCPHLVAKDLIIAKTPPFEVPMMLLAHGTNAKTIFVGKPKRLSREFFTHLISTPSTPVSPASVYLSMMPTHINYDDIVEINNIRKDDNKVLFFLLGGKSQGFSYNNNDWEQICDCILYLSQKYAKQVLVSTSPRTGKDGERIIKQRLSSNSNIESIYFWGERKAEEASPMIPFIAASDCLFVTEDSAGMISDALVARRPLITLRLQENNYNSLSTPLVTYHEKRDHLLRLIVGEEAKVDITTWGKTVFIPLQKSWREELTSQLLNSLF